MTFVVRLIPVGRPDAEGKRNAFCPIPDPILKKLGWSAGTRVEVEILPNRTVRVFRPAADVIQDTV